MKPDFVKSGEPIKASWANDVVSSVRSTTGNPNNLNRQIKRIFKPFDVMEVKKSGGNWQLLLQAGFIDGESVKFSGTALTEYPTLSVTPSKDLFYNWKEKELVWDDPNSEANMKILELTYDGDSFKIRNLHPQNIDTSRFPPFTPLFSKTASNYFVALTEGYVCARDITGVTGGALTFNLPLSCGNHYPISNGQQVSVICNVTKTGTLSSTPTIAIEPIDEDSTHFYPDVADGSGQGGTYHYKMAEFSTTLNKVMAGSHIDHYVDINEVDNTYSVSLSGAGRLVKEYSETTGITFIRAIKERDEEPQVRITENIDDVLIEGNGIDGTLTYTVNESSPITVLQWVDGLVTSLSANIHVETSTGTGMLSGNYGDMIYHNGTEWTLLENPGVPGAGDRWVIHHNGTLPQYRLYQELTVSICISGVPTDYTILGNLVV